MRTAVAVIVMCARGAIAWAQGPVVTEPVQPFQPWTEATAIVQPWSGERTEAMVEDRAAWIPRLQQMGFQAVIFIPGPGDIEPNYPTEVLRAAIDDYHAAGMKVLMYWSVMHVGHHETWHTVGSQHPEWWQRDAEGGTVDIYGDHWLCPNTGALDYCIDLGIRLARELDVDGVMLDNQEFYWTRVGATCYCAGCESKFRHDMREQLGDARLRRMGLDPEAIRCPLPGEALFPYWVDWRYRAWREATETFRTRLREAIPGIVLTANTQYKYKWPLGVLEVIGGEDMLFSESKNQLGPVMSWKLAYGRALAGGKPIWNYLDTWPDDDPTCMLSPDEIYDRVCTSLAWNTSPWIVGYGLISRQPAFRWVRGDYSRDGRGSWLRAEGEGVNGSTAVRLSGDGPVRISVSHQPFIPVQAGQRFSFRCHYRVAEMTEGLPRVRITFVDAKHKAPTGKPYVFYVDGSRDATEWTELALDEIVAPAGAEVVNVEPFLWNADGTVWYDDVQLLRDGENLVENGDFETAADDATRASREALARCLNFQREHRELYRGATLYADVGLFVSRHSADFGYEYMRYPSGSMQALLSAHIPFEVVLEGQLGPERLAKYRVLIAPVASCLGDNQIRTLARYVLSGGNLIFTGRTAMLDPYGKERGTDVLAKLLGRRRAEMTEPVKVGKGRALWIADDPGRRWEKNPSPAELKVLSDAVRALGGGGQVRIEGAPEAIEVTCYAQARERRIILHLDNQRYGGPRPDLQIGVELPGGWTQQGPARYLDLDGSTRNLGSGDTLTVPTPERYAVVVIECG
ncbi:MAG: beta-galactosidase trimerization domain-containing protein [Armatimonadetes bacterium]|nr:beta-galactosidase trimerization domain-containing protein [Armatimonadota bacterium]